MFDERNREHCVVCWVCYSASDRRIYDIMKTTRACLALCATLLGFSLMCVYMYIYSNQRLGHVSQYTLMPAFSKKRKPAKKALNEEKSPAVMKTENVDQLSAINVRVPGKTTHDRRGSLPGFQAQNISENITVFVRMTSNEKYLKRFYCLLYKTMVLFWPTYIPAKLMLVLDKESAIDHLFAENLIRKNQENSLTNLKIEIAYEELPADKSVLNIPMRTPGYNRQLWSSFFNDLHTNDPVIAWMDTDTFFVSPVTLDSIYKGGKIKIVGHNKLHIGWVQSWDHTTRLALGYPMVVDFMTYFPVYLYRDTYTNCRNYILSRFKTSRFEEAFKKFYKTSLSPSNIILSYAWYFERDRYDWHFEIGTALDVYNKRLPSQHKILEEDTRPMPQTAFHSYISNKKDIRIGYCLTQIEAGHKLPPSCHNYTRVKQHLVLYVYGANTPETWCKGGKHARTYCLQLLREHYKTAGRELRQGKRRMDWSDLERVENMARVLGMDCEQQTEPFQDNHRVPQSSTLSCLVAILVTLGLLLLLNIFARKLWNHSRCYNRGVNKLT